MVEWRVTPDLVAYEVSDSGLVRRADTGQILKATENNRGYLVQQLNCDGRRRNFSVHRLVARCFIPNPDGKPQVNHKDGNKRNNSVENLEWCTGKENVRHAVALGLVNTVTYFRGAPERVGHGRIQKGEANFNSKITEDDVRAIRASAESGTTKAALAREFGVSPSMIGWIVKRQRWAHID